MKRFLLLAAVVAFTIVGPSSLARASEREDADSLERLRAEVAHRLPDGWTVTAEAAHRLSPHDDESPALVIASKEKLATETVFPGSAPRQEPYKETRQIEIVLTVRPYLTAEQYARLRAKDDEIVKARSAAEHKLREIPWAYKGPDPVPPSAFRPRNEQERRRVMEYALLWNRSSPEPLPTHHFETLSVDLTLPLETSAIVDKAKAKEYGEIVKALDGLLKPYERQLGLSN